MNFPENPTNGMIFELEYGVLYEFDASTNSWIKITSNSLVLQEVTPVQAGVMTSDDLVKLNSLVLPPPQSTIIGNDCTTPFSAGAISLTTGDEYISVQGNVNIQNIDEFGAQVSQAFPFHIHKHTFGFDFTVNLDNLVQELDSRGQLNYVGPPGDQGPIGDRGDRGVNNVLSGPEGFKGPRGGAPPCEISIEPEPVIAQAREGLKKALVDVRVVIDPTDDTKYTLEFDRQNVGSEVASSSKFNVRQSNSFWVLAVTSVAGAPQQVYYLDVEPIISNIRQKYLDELELLRQGYEDIVKFWVQTMSDLFDEQKNALCCSIEFCASKTAGVGVREHIESVAAAAIGSKGARVKLNEKGSPQALSLSPTRLRPSIGLPDVCGTGVAFSQDAESGDEIQTQAADPDLYVINATKNTGSSKNGVGFNLPKGRYVAIIEGTDSFLNGKYHAPLKVQYSLGGLTKTSAILNKGQFDNPGDSQKAYTGLTLPFDHDGGEVVFFYNVLAAPQDKGDTVIRVNVKEDIPNAVVQVQDTFASKNCRFTKEKIKWYEEQWKSGNCCSLTFNISGQDYVAVKVSSGEDETCGSGENLSEPCISKFLDSYGHPAIAWPTLDGKNFAPVATDSVVFRFDENINALFFDIIESKKYSSNDGHRKITHVMEAIITPVL